MVIKVDGPNKDLYPKAMAYRIEYVENSGKKKQTKEMWHLVENYTDTEFRSSDSRQIITTEGLGTVSFPCSCSSVCFAS